MMRGPSRVQACLVGLGQYACADQVRISNANEIAPGREVTVPTVSLVPINEVFEVTQRHDCQKLYKTATLNVYVVDLDK